MKTKHTPGPWKFINDTLVRGPHGEPIASTKGFAFPCAAEHEANAKLIAAAPKLLDAARELLDFLDRYPHPFYVDISEYQTDLIIAVAEAEGRE